MGFTDIFSVLYRTCVLVPLFLTFCMLFKGCCSGSLTGVGKTVISLILLACFAGSSYAVLVLPVMVIGKILFVAVMLVGALLCWLVFANIPALDGTLTAIQQECELATNLTYLQAEMTRAQLEELSLRLKDALKPEQREMTQTMLKAVSPILMLYFKKERSILKWSMTAVGIGKDLMKYFWSSKEPD